MTKNNCIYLLALAIFCSLITSCNKCYDCNEMSQKIAVMSFNIRYDNPEDGVNKWNNRKEACLLMINDKLPSIFGIQEGLSHQVQYLNENLPNYAYIGVGRDDGSMAGEYCAIFYQKEQFEEVETNTFWLSETPNIPSVGWDAALERIVTWAHLKDIENQKSIFIFNTHFDHEGNNARKNSAKLLSEKIKEITQGNYPVFITGDFNALLSQKQVFNLILEEHSNAQTTAPITDNKKTYNVWGALGGLLSRTIDFIFYNNVEIISYETITKKYGVPYISDHYPIISKFYY